MATNEIAQTGLSSLPPVIYYSEQLFSYAVEAGYLGERNVSTWRKHMKTLHELGFIDVKGGAYGPYNFILLLNPYLIMKKLENKISPQSFSLLLQRAIEIGADKDLADK